MKHEESQVSTQRHGGSQPQLLEPSKLASGLKQRLQSEFSAPSLDVEQLRPANKVQYPTRMDEMVETQPYESSQRIEEGVESMYSSKYDDAHIEQHKENLQSALRREGSVKQMGRTANEFSSKRQLSKDAAHNSTYSDQFDTANSGQKKSVLQPSQEIRMFDEQEERQNSSVARAAKNKATSAIGHHKKDEGQLSKALLNNAYEHKLSNYFQNPGRKGSNQRNIPTMNAELKKKRILKRPKMVAQKDLSHRVAHEAGAQDTLASQHAVPPLNGNVTSQREISQHLQSWYRDHQPAASEEASELTRHSRAANLNTKNRALGRRPQAHVYDGQQQQNFFPSVANGEEHQNGQPLPQIRPIPKVINSATMREQPNSMQPQINVHQHFNQPNITNFNHNAFFVDHKNNINGSPNTLNPLYQNAYQLSNLPPNKAKGRSQMATAHAFQGKTQGAKMTTFQSSKKAGGGFPADQSILSDQASNVTYPKGNRRRLISLERSPRGVIQINEQTLEDDQSSVARAGRDETLERAIKLQSKFFDNRQTQRQLYPNISYVPANFRRYRDYYLRMQQRNNVVDIQSMNKQGSGKNIQSHQYLLNHYGSRQQYTNISQKSLHNKKDGISRERSLAAIDKEDLYEQLFILKKELNMLQKDHTKMKTRNQIMQEQLKAKDKLMDEMLKTTDAANIKLYLEKAERELPEVPTDGGSVQESAKLRSRKKGSRDRTRMETERNGQYTQMTVFELKRQVNDLKEQLSYKTNENADIQRSLKNLKVSQLQEEVQIYQRECQKLRHLNEQVIRIAHNKGFAKHLQSSRSVKQFMDINMVVDGEGSRQSTPKKSQQAKGLESVRRSHQSGASSKDSMALASKRSSRNIIAKELVAQNSKMTDMLESNRRDQEQIFDEMNRVKFERDQLIELDIKKNKIIEQLEMRIKQLESQKKATLTRKQGRESPPPVMDSFNSKSQASLANSKKSISPTKPTQKHKNNMNQVVEVHQAVLARSSEKQAKVLRSMESSHQDSVEDHALKDLQQEHTEMQRKLSEQEDQNNVLRKEIEALKKQKKEKVVPRNSQTLKSSETIKSSIQYSKKESRSKAESEANPGNNKQQEDHNKQVIALQKQVGQKDQKIKALEKQLQELRAQKQTKGTKIDPKAQFMHLKGDPKAASMKRHPTEYVSAKNATQYKNRSDSINERADEGDSQMTDAGLKQEIKDIEHKLENVKLSEVDDRSDFAFSQVNSVVHGANDSQQSPRNQESKEPFKSPYIQMANNTIKEEQNEDLENSNANLEIHKKVSRDRQIEIREEKTLRETRLGTGDELDKSRSQSEVHKLSPRKLTVMQPRQDHNLLNQLDAIPNESKYSFLDTETVQNMSDVVSTAPKQLMKFVEEGDPSVQLGMERLGRLLQMKGVPLGQVEKVVLQGQYKPQQSIKIYQLQQILQNLLGLDMVQSLDFARFLIEERDEDDKTQSLVEFDPNRRVNSQYIPIRLQTRFKKYPTVFPESAEKAVINKISEQVSAKDQKKFVQRLNEQEEAIISKEHFHKELKAIEDLKITDEELDCAYIYLSRGGHLSQFDGDAARKSQLSASHLKEKVKGFDSQDITLLFPQTKTMSSVLDDEDSEKYTEIDKESIKAEAVDEPVEDEIDDPKYTDPDDPKYTEPVEDIVKMSEPIEDDEDVEYTEPVEEEVADMKMTEQSVEDETTAAKAKQASDAKGSGPSDAKAVASTKPGQDKQLPRVDSRISEQIETEGSLHKSPSDLKKDAVEQQKKDDNIKAVLESIREENERVKQEGKVRNSLESHDTAKSKDNAEAGEKDGQDASKLRNNVQEPAEIDDKSKQPDEAAPKQQEGQGMDVTRSDLDLDQQESMSPGRLDKIKNANNEEQEKQQATLNEVKEEKDEGLKSDDERRRSDKSPENKRYEFPDEEEEQVAVAEADQATNQQQEPSKPGQQPSDGKQEAQDKDNNAKSKEQQQNQANEGEYEYYDEEDYGEENADEQQEKKGETDKAQDEEKAAGSQKAEDQDQAASKPKEESKPGAVPEEQEEDKKSENAEKEQNNDDQIKEKAPEKPPAQEVPQKLLIALAKVYQKNTGAPANKIDIRNTIFAESARIIFDYAETITKQYPELMDSCRDLFREVIYSIYDEEKLKDEAFVKEGGNKKGEEVEILLPEDLLYKLENQINYTLSVKQRQCLDKIFRNSKIQNNYYYSDLRDVFSSLGICDYKTPKGATSTAHLNYDTLDLKSIRLVNRMIHHLGSHQIAFSSFMADLIQKQEVKTQTSEQEIEIFMARAFFEKLHKHGIKKTPAPYPNLCYFLCIDRKYKKYLMLKKLKRCIIDFNQSAYFQSIGLKKMKLAAHDHANHLQRRMTVVAQDVKEALAAATFATPSQGERGAQEGEYEYYDEEDEGDTQEAGVDTTTAPPQLDKQSTPIQSHDQKSKGGSGLQGPTVNKSGGDAQEEYEYYDEEDDAAAQQQRQPQPPAKPSQIKSAPKIAQSAPKKSGQAVAPAPRAEKKAPDKAKGKAEAQAPQAAKNDEYDPEYEYYDEEEDG